ncbi:hypothetical protein Aeh1ORF100c [Aeromonas phage Aeh1]|uniref:Uncharacterized protein n=1 Tax=Aeromonas phage Aeh1 TaxID=2880362 RepID=Q76YY5_9CAUD|nr:hypothetical protein Aeh1p106 [Aeromonas phage Aeh1]AAQ17761.1 hypothetical protein Aeh1ORF100c [Aeromonas phage Aeh1]
MQNIKPEHKFSIGDIIGTTSGTFEGIFGKVVERDHSKSVYQGKVKYHSRYQIEAWYMDDNGKYQRVKAKSGSCRLVHVAESNCTEIFDICTISDMSIPNLDKFKMIETRPSFPYPEILGSVKTENKSIDVSSDKYTLIFNGKQVEMSKNELKTHMIEQEMFSAKVYVPTVVKLKDLI